MAVCDGILLWLLDATAIHYSFMLQLSGTLTQLLSVSTKIILTRDSASTHTYMYYHEM